MTWYNNWGDLIGDLGDIAQGKNPTNNQSGKPDPTVLSQGNGGASMPTTSTDLTSMPNGSGAPNVGTSAYGSSGASNFTQAQQAQLQSALSAAGIWGTIEGLGSDVWSFIGSVLPKNADGSINWGAIGSDVAGWVKSNASTILSGLTAYENYSRQNTADQLGQQALSDAKAQYATQAPLRIAGMAGMLTPSANAPDLSKLGAMATAGQSLTAPQPIPLGQNRTNLTTVAGPGSGNPFATALPVAPSPMTAPTLPSVATSSAPPIPLASPAPYTPSKFGAQPIPLAGAPGTPATTNPQPPGLTPQKPNVFGPTPPKLTLPYSLVSPTT